MRREREREEERLREMHRQREALEVGLSHCFMLYLFSSFLLCLGPDGGDE